MINYQPIDDAIEYLPVESQLRGYYFKSPYHYTTYLIEITSIEQDVHCKVRVYEVVVQDQQLVQSARLRNDDLIVADRGEADLVLELDLRNKYYFPVLHKKQWYYDDADTDSVAAFTQVMQHAVAIGLRNGAIPTY